MKQGDPKGRYFFETNAHRSEKARIEWRPIGRRFDASRGVWLNSFRVRQIEGKAAMLEQIIGNLAISIRIGLKLGRQSEQHPTANQCSRQQHRDQRSPAACNWSASIRGIGMSLMHT